MSEVRALVPGDGIEVTEDVLAAQLRVRARRDVVAYLEDLDDDATEGLGADMVALRLTGAGQQPIKVGPFLNTRTLRVKGNFRAAGNGVALDTTAVANAITTPGKAVVLDAGTYLCDALPVPRCSAIIGEGEDVSILKFTGGVTKGLGLNSDDPSGRHPTQLKHFRLDGSLTTNGTGLYLGDVADRQVAVYMEGVRTVGWGGANGVGTRYGEVLKATAVKCTNQHNGTNCEIWTTGGTGLPTTLNLYGCVDTDSTSGPGMRVRQGSAIRIHGHDWESSWLEGLVVEAGGARTVTDLQIEGGWCEDNGRAWPTTGTPGALRSDHYHMRFGENMAGGTVRAGLNGTYFQCYGNADTTKAIHLNGPEVAGFELRSPVFGASGAACVDNILVENGANGYTSGWNPAFSFVDVVKDPLNRLAAPHNAGYRSWAPVVSSDIGNAAATFAGGAVSVLRARFKYLGGTTLIELSLSATLNAVTPNRIEVELPAGITTVSNEAWAPAMVKATAFETGILRANGGNKLYFYRPNFANFPASADIALNVVLALATA